MKIPAKENHKISTFYYLVLLVLFMIPFQSCNKNNDLPDLNEKMSIYTDYLDVDVSNIANFSDQQKEILMKARTRIDSYVVYKRKTYILTVSSGSEIQMSERLFDLFKDQMKQTNELLKDLDVIQDIKDSKRLHVKNRNSNIVRLKSGGIEADDAKNISDVDVNWYGIDIYLSYHDLNVLVWGCGTISLVTGLIPEPLYTKIICFIAGEIALSAAYFMAECPDGIVFTYSFFGFNSVRAQ